MEKLQRHWNREHPNFRFPEIKPESGFSWAKETKHTNGENVGNSISKPYSPRPSTSKSHVSFAASSTPVTSLSSKSSESESESESAYEPDVSDMSFKF